MPIRTIEHGGNKYPAFQAEGFAAKFAMPYAQQVCKGYGCDVGCNRKEWLYRDADGIDALPIDPAICTEYDAMHLPLGTFDYIFSSHCLEHIADWVSVVDYWRTRMKKGGVLFLYLPDYSQTYWRAWHNRKHIHCFTPQMLRDYLTDRGWQNIFVSERDLNNSFMVMANTPE